jgi:hypothetical protein
MKRPRQLMQKVSKTALFISCSFICFTSCNSVERETVNTTEGRPKPFASSADAVQQGKKDLEDLFKVRSDLNLGVDASQIKKSQSGRGMDFFEVDFRKLLQAESISGLDKLVDAPKGNITPLSVDKLVIGVIETRQDADGWRVSALSNPAIKEDLNEIRKVHADSIGSKMSYFEIPNIQARIYSISLDGQIHYLTNYDGFSFEKPVSFSQLLLKLKEDAQRFEKLYGEKLKRQKLVR